MLSLGTEVEYKDIDYVVSRITHFKSSEKFGELRSVFLSAIDKRRSNIIVVFEDVKDIVIKFKDK